MKRFFLLFLLLPLFSATAHKFYVSKTVIEYNQRSQTFEVMCKVFTDDLELAIGSTDDNPIRLGTSKEPSNADALIENYVRKHFKIKYNDEPIHLTFVGKEAEADLTYIYFEFFKPQEYNTISLESTILYEHFHDQQNIIDLRANASTKTVILTKDRSREVIFR
jgi:carbonic anhydrase